MKVNTLGSFETDEETYRRMRKGLLGKYRGKWVAIHDGRVVATGDELTEVIKKGFAVVGDSPFYVNKVGRRPRLDAASTGLDDGYAPPFPWCTVALTDPFKTKVVSKKGYIDTGSDGSILPAELAKELDLLSYPLMRVEACGIGGKPEKRILYAAYVRVNGIEVAIAVDAGEDVDMVLLGRDVLQCTKVEVDWERGTVEDLICSLSAIPALIF